VSSIEKLRPDKSKFQKKKKKQVPERVRRRGWGKIGRRETLPGRGKKKKEKVSYPDHAGLRGNRWKNRENPNAEKEALTLPKG